MTLLKLQSPYHVYSLYSKFASSSSNSQETKFQHIQATQTKHIYIRNATEKGKKEDRRRIEQHGKCWAFYSTAATDTRLIFFIPVLYSTYYFIDKDSSF